MARATRTRSAEPKVAREPEIELPDADELERLKLSPEVAWYLASRGVPYPDCPPLHKTPEPRDEPGARFDAERVDHVLKVFGLLRHTQGQWAGQSLKPDPWQVAYILAPVFGWVIWDDDAAGYVRIISSCFTDVSRRNGKTTLCGGIAVYLTTADGEPGAQVVAAATTRDQASFVFSPVKHLAEQAPALKPHVRALARKIVHTKSGSTFEVVSSVAEAQHGANLHGAVIDELHVHKTPDLVETIETGTGSRRQPLIFIITTADSGRQGTIYARKRERIEQLARGALQDSSTYGVVWAADRDADPFAEETWRSANPGYGVSPTRNYLKRAAAEAQQSPADLAKFRRLHLGIRTKQETRYFELADWDANAGLIRPEDLAGRRCFGGLDLANTSDLCALAWLFPDGAGGFDAQWRFWAPETALERLDKATAGLVRTWVAAGWITETPGNVADYDYIRTAVGEDLTRFDVTELGYDPWNASQLVNDLVADGAPMVQVRQGFATMSPPTKEVLRLLRQGTPERPMLRHGGNPVMRWMTDNFAVAMDPAGNVKPDKARAGDKIDGWSAAITAFARALAAPDPEAAIPNIW